MHTSDLSRYQHAHVFHFSGGQAEKMTLRVVWLTAGMMVIEIVAGWIFNSMALLADGWHMSTHALALGISWLAFVLARRCATDRRFAFGTWKIEVLGGFVSGIFLGVVGIAMMAVSAERFLYPASIRYDQALVVAVAGLAVNVLSIFLLNDHPDPHGHGPHAKDHGHDHAPASVNLRAAYLHVLADALTSVFAIGALLGGKYLRWNWLDPLMGVVGGVLVIRWTCFLLQETGGILLDRETNDALAVEIRKAIEADGDSRISDFHLWKVGQAKYACIIGVVTGSSRTLEYYKTRLKTHDALVHVTVEIKPCEDSPGG
jgi:cation diffusion facilitator family transporter